MIAIERLKVLGYTLSVRADGRIGYKFHGDLAPREAAVLLAEVKRQRAAAVAYLVIWPPESYESERKFRPGPCRLYPFIGKDVMTPLGQARLWQVGSEKVGVVLPRDPKHVEFLPWAQIRPTAKGLR